MMEFTLLVTPMILQSNSFLGNFVKLMCKFKHTSVVSIKDPKQELKSHTNPTHKQPENCQQNCSTVGNYRQSCQWHSHCLRNPTYLMFINIAITINCIKKPCMTRNSTIPKNLKIGDQILIKHTITTIYPPVNHNTKPYTAIAINDNQITAICNGQPENKKRAK